MAGPRFTDLTEMTDTPAATDVFCLSDISAGQSKKIRYDTLKGPTSTKTADYTITRDNEKVFVSGTVQITLAAASFAWGAKVFNIGSGIVTVATQGSDTIEGSASIRLAGDMYASVSLHGNGGLLYVKS